MYPEEVYDELRRTHAEYFVTAEKIFKLVLQRNMLLVRGYVWRTPKNRMMEFAEIEVTHLEYNNSGERQYDALMQLKFRTESNLQSNTLGFLGISLLIDGPTWNGNPIQKDDIINQLATYVADWSIFKTEWLDVRSESFLGYYVLSENLHTKISAHHPLMFPFICMCFGAFRGSYDDQLATARKTSGTEQSGNAREKALMSFFKRFGSFVAQAQRENARNYFGSFFASQAL